MKKLFTLFMLVILISSTVFPVWGSVAGAVIPENRLLPRLVDKADLLSPAEADKLLERLDEISERQKLDLVVVTTNSLEGKSPTAFADDFFDYNGYGFGPTHDGILFLISMEDRDWAISTTGYGITVFTDAGQRFMMESILKELKKNNFAKAFDVYAKQCDAFITQANSGAPYDTGNLPKRPLSPLWILFSLLGGVLLALIVTGSMKSSLKSVLKQKAAQSYIIKNSVNITDSKDLFLFSTVSRTLRPQSSSSSGSSGSSTHVSSSGTTHGGSSGKF